MFGKNPVVTRSNLQHIEGYFVKDIFATIQGEGPDAGTPAIFVRMANCCLRCYFCDTDFSSEGLGESSVNDVVYRVLELTCNNGINYVVITGGEPFLYDLTPLIESLLCYKISVGIETSGSLFPHQSFVDSSLIMSCLHSSVKIVCSPKTVKLANGVSSLVSSYKYIVRRGEVSESDGLPNMSTQLKGKKCKLFRPPGGTPKSNIFVQPCDDYDEQANIENRKQAVESCIRFGYRLSLQQHKILDLP